MKVTFIGHASILIEAGGTTLLSDPWWRGPCFGAQWWTYPLPYLDALADKRIDYIYLSHGHHDHFHPGTLNTLPRTAIALVSDALDLAEPVKALGFEVKALRADEELAIGGGLTCRIMPTYGHDTLMAVSDGNEICINLNDALHSAPTEVQDRFIARLRALYPRIDYVFCGYGVASHFPNCYMIPGKNRELTAKKRQAYFNRQWARIIDGLAPRYGFPFAADVVLFEDDLQWANEPVHNGERPTAVFAELYPQSPTRVYDIGPGFNVEAGRLSGERLRDRISIDAARDECPEAVARANSYGSVSSEAVAEVRALLDENIAQCGAYLESYPEDYRFLIRFRNGASAIEIRKTGNRVTTHVVPAEAADDSACDVTYMTRLAYLRQSLATDFGHEILFVGSGGIFRYADSRKARANVHRELIVMMRRQKRALPPRRRGLGRVVGWMKRVLKAWFGRRDEDLYDLGQWTVLEK